ncbi:MAG: class I SAM-dependent methyltransferase, partial [Cyclobacteriaceae bacterium]
VEEVKTALYESGFDNIELKTYSIHGGLEDKFLYCGKHEPESYLNDQIRKGISSFSALSNEEEVKKGMEILKTDIQTGKIKKIIEHFENDFGDYIFIKARKTINCKS